MVVDSGVLGELGRQVRRENVREVRILGGDLCRSLLGNQAGYLRPPKRVDIEGRERGGTEGCDMNYVSLMFRIECCSCKLFLTNKFNASGSREGLLGSVSSLPKVSTWKIDICITQGEERHPKDYFWTDISH